MKGRGLKIAFFINFNGRGIISVNARENTKTERSGRVAFEQWREFFIERTNLVSHEDCPLSLFAPYAEKFWKYGTVSESKPDSIRFYEGYFHIYGKMWGLHRRNIERRGIL